MALNSTRGAFVSTGFDRIVNLALGARGGVTFVLTTAGCGQKGLVNIAKVFSAGFFATKFLATKIFSAEVFASKIAEIFSAKVTKVIASSETAAEACCVFLHSFCDGGKGCIKLAIIEQLTLVALEFFIRHTEQVLRNPTTREEAFCGDTGN